MNRDLTATSASTSASSRPADGPTVVLIRLAILLTLLWIAFRPEVREMMVMGGAFSEWSHLFALPVVAVFFVWCRRDDLRAALTNGSRWGIVLILAGLGLWFARVVFAQFGYIKLISLWVCVVGLVPAIAGWRVARTCIPLFLMIWLCLPLSERTMDSKSLPLQRLSLRAAVWPLKACPGATFKVTGKTLSYEKDSRRGDIGLAEQRFGARYLPACFLVGLLVVFHRRRPGWQVLILVLAAVPIVLCANILRIDAWAVATAYGGIEPVSAVSRQVSQVVALSSVFACFALLCWLLPRIGWMAGQMFTIEDSSESDGAGSAAVGSTQED